MATTDLGSPDDYDLTPVEHDPFTSLTPVEHDPFAGANPPPAQPYTSATLASSPLGGQSMSPESPRRFSEMVGQAAERGADTLGAPMSTVRWAGDVGKSAAGMTGLDLPEDVSDAANYAKQGAYGEAALAGAMPFAAMALGPMAKITPEAEDLAERSFQRLLQEKYPTGAPIYHESPGHVAQSFYDRGIDDDYGVFGAVGQPSNFVISPKKTVVRYRLPPREYENLFPDMSYDPDSPYSDLLQKHPDLRGAYVSLNRTVPPHWIESADHFGP